ncbi:hypothetical protein GCM10010441_07960 [Kitasatospora paracochleata]|uniref:Uncharacterized protein n=1 Tax=Kitasatospora paracochleata TaxID=58354 RepID=A0ABT1JAP7_9ACTN|nr:hypothetical protein [Kitasatospora paracochleata]MCP2314131.1 hypothetical protein [Kitasatospora paracochleata]
MRWALRHALHPKANTTTLRVAEALADKANRRGQLAYGRNTLAVDLHLSVPCVASHTRILRELGLLVWVQHGSKANVLRTRAPQEEPTAYKATGTIFALVVPPPYDREHGRRTSGDGYNARLVSVSDRGRRHEIRMAKAATRRHATRPTAGRRKPPSCGGLALNENLKARGKINYTRTRARERPSHRLPQNQPLTPSLTREFIQAAEAIQLEVPWLAHTCSRRLAFVLRSRLTTGATVSALSRELAHATTQFVRQPLAYLANHLQRHPTPPVEAEHRVDQPFEWIQVSTVASRPSPISLLPLVSTRFLEPADDIPSGIRHDPVLVRTWEERQVALALQRTLEYWHERDRQRGHHWDTIDADDPFQAPDAPDLEWIPVYA